MREANVYLVMWVENGTRNFQKYTLHSNMVEKMVKLLADPSILEVNVSIHEA